MSVIGKGGLAKAGLLVLGTPSPPGTAPSSAGDRHSYTRSPGPDDAGATSGDISSGIQTHANIPNTLAQAAEARRKRLKHAVKAEPADYIPYVERSDLCRSARRCVWSWASGYISGRQCVLRLEICESITNLLKQAESEATEEEDQEKRNKEAALWLVGCVRLGVSSSNMNVLRDDLEKKSPTQMLLEAWAAVEQECHEPADNLDMEEVNSALRRLSATWKVLATMDPGNYIRVQVWRELIRLSEGAEDDEELWSDQPRVSTTCGGEEDLDDAAVLEWIQMPERRIREKAAGMSHDQLSAESGRLLDLAAQMVRMGTELKEALEDWEHFDAYRVLGVAKDAPMGVIRRAFYKQALKLHPDKGGDKEAFQELQRAYDEIVSERRRQAKDDEPNDSSDVAHSPTAKHQLQGPERECSGKVKMEAPDPTEAASGGAQVNEQVSSGLQQIDLIVKSALAASAGTGQCAVEASRHFWDMLEALEMEGQMMDMKEGCSTAEATLLAAEGVVETATLVEQHTRMACNFLLAYLTRHEVLALDDDSEDGDHVVGKLQLEEAAGSAALAADAVAEGVAACSSAIADAHASLKQSNDLLLLLCGSASVKIVMCGASAQHASDDGIHGGCLAMLRSTVGALVDTTQALALKALDASVAAADAEKVLQNAARQHAMHRTEQETEVAKEAEDDGDNGDGDNQATDETREEEHEKENQHSSSSSSSSGDADEYNPDSEAWKSFEARMCLSTLLEAVRMLRVTNRELRRTQQAARELGERESRAQPEMTTEHRERALALLAEFMDEAAVRFHETLQAGVGNLGNLGNLGSDVNDVNSVNEGNSVVKECVEEAFQRSFGFVLRCRPQLAVSLDARSQTLRAAIAVDDKAVKQLVQVDVAMRLQHSLMSVLLEARGGAAALVDDNYNEALQALDVNTEALAEALISIQLGLSGISQASNESAGKAGSSHDANSGAAPTETASCVAKMNF